MPINSTPMRVVLINPPLIACLKTYGANPVVDNLFYNSPPLGLCYIAAVLEREGMEVRVIDAAVECLSYEAVLRRARDFQPMLVGITATTFAFADAAELAARLKKNDPALPVIVGGPHVSAVPESALLSGCFDAGVIGEGELTVLEMAQALAAGRDFSGIAGVVTLRESRLVSGPPRPLIENLDTLPFPARHLVPMQRYVPQPNDERLLPKLSMITSRGCPYDCIFCDKSVYGRTYRSFSADYIVAEMKQLIREYGARDIAFVDSLFTVSEQRVEQIMAKMHEQGVRVGWTCTVRANVVQNGELFRKMKRSGCWRVRIGIESGNDSVLRFIRKNTAKEQVARVAAWADEAGLQPKGFFMVGHLVDTPETIQETIDFACQLPLKDITIQMNTPLPGTPQFPICGEYGKLLTGDMSKFSLCGAVFIPRAFTKESLEEMLNRFYRSFYLRPVIVWRHVKRIRSFHDIARYVKAGALLLFLFFGKTVSRDRR